MIDAYIAAFAWFGYVPCGSDSSLEDGWEKIALYGKTVLGRTEGQHAARQLSDGRWTSKLGSEEDIAHLSVRNLYHTPPHVDYGEVVLYLKRRRSFNLVLLLRRLRTRLLGALETKRRIHRLSRGH